MKTRIGLVGCGAWGRYILRDLVALGCEVDVVARSGESRARAVAGGAARVVPTIAELPEVDGAVVATPSIVHADTVEALLDRRIPLFVEKPLAPDAARAARLVAAAPERIFVMHKWRYHPGVEAIAAIARSGELGAVQGLRLTRVGFGLAHADTDTPWHLAPHDLSIALEVLGSLPPARAAAAERIQGDATGLFALLGTSPWIALEVSCTYGPRRREVRLHCEGGLAALYDAYDPHVEVVRGDRREGNGWAVERRPISPALPLYRELAAFVAHVGGGPPPRSSAAEALRVVEAIAALRALAGLS